MPYGRLHLMAKNLFWQKDTQISNRRLKSSEELSESDINSVCKGN